MPRDLREELLRPAAYGPGVTAVRHLQTHISHLFFAGGRVYKVKKPVDLGFLDYSTLAARRHFCEEEVRLNRRLAEDVYLGVVPIREGQDGHLVVGDGDGPIVEYAVAMRELPAHRMLDRLLAAGDVDNELIRKLAHRIAEFHRDAATGAWIDEHGSLLSVRRNCEENFAQTAPFVGDTISATLHGFLRARTAAFLDANAGRFHARVAQGRIREGHGDLHAGNICVLPDRIVAYDCIEFAPRFRCGDVAADLAFLLMDLDLRRYRAFATYLLRCYVEAGDADMTPLVRFYKGYRALVRFKVECMGLAGRAGAELASAREHAMAYAHLAASYELPPALVLCCGLPGSGKSFAASLLARPFEGVVLESDATRKRLAGIAATRSARAAVDEGIYTEATSARTYDALRSATAQHLAKGRTVFVDAGFRSRQQREPFRALAAERSVPLVLVHVDTAEGIVRERLASRSSGGRSTSDAGVEVYEALAARFEPPLELPPAQVLRHDGVSPLADLGAALIDRLVAAASTR